VSTEANKFLEEFRPVLQKHACTIEIETNSTGEITPKVVNRFVSSCSDAKGIKFKQIPENNWSILTKEHATVVLEYMIRKDLATQTELLDSTTAKALTAKFFKLFDNCTYFTNASWGIGPQGPTLGKHHGISNVEIDSGIVAVGAKVLGVVWFESDHE